MDINIQETVLTLFTLSCATFINYIALVVYIGDFFDVSILNSDEISKVLKQVKNSTHFVILECKEHSSLGMEGNFANACYKVGPFDECESVLISRLENIPLFISFFFDMAILFLDIASRVSWDFVGLSYYS